jgi:hypothetical protein
MAFRRFQQYDLEHGPQRLHLPRGSVIRPQERTFVLPDGQALRLHNVGLRAVPPKGAETRRTDAEVYRLPPQGTYRSQADWQPSSVPAGQEVAYRTQSPIEFILPYVLIGLFDPDLNELAQLMMEQVIELEMELDLDGGDLVGELMAERHHDYVHVIDLSHFGMDYQGPQPGDDGWVDLS